MEDRLTISKRMAEMLKKYGEDKIMEVLKAWEKKCEWQRNRYHQKIKPLVLAHRKELNDQIAKEMEATREKENT